MGQPQMCAYRLLSQLSTRFSNSQRQQISALMTRRDYSTPTRRSFIDRLSENLKEELRKNKDLQDNLSKLRQEAKQANESDSLKQARAKFDLVSEQTLKSSERVRQKLDELNGHMKMVLAEAQKSAYGKRAAEVGQRVLEASRSAADAVEQTARSVGDTAVFQHVEQAMQSVKAEIDELAFADARMYSSPKTLRTRGDGSLGLHVARTVAANPDATGLELHKEARWAEGFRSWAANNSVYNRFLGMKMRFDESENPVVRIFRSAVDRVSSLGEGDLSKALTEIVAVDAAFDRDAFVRYCELEMIPNVAEAVNRGEMDVLKDWSYEPVYKKEAFLQAELQRSGLRTVNRLLDFGRVEIASGGVLEQGPILVIHFESHEIAATKNLSGVVVDGSPVSRAVAVRSPRYVALQMVPRRFNNAWAVCRDLAELDPQLAWRVIEVHKVPIA